jgi:MFS family permease
MGKKYLVGPFLCTLAGWIVGNGTIALLPLYAIERGASAAGSGLMLAFAFGCLALGTFAPGLLPKHFAHRRTLLVTSGILWVLLCLLISRTTTLLPFAGGCGGFYFLGGVTFSQATVLTGLGAPEKERGTAFGILGMTNGLGSLIGGFGVGWLAYRFGFPGVFQGAAAVSLLCVAGGLLSIDVRADRTSSPTDPEAVDVAKKNVPRHDGLRSVVSEEPAGAFGVGLLLLLAANLLLSLTNSTTNLGRSLMMDQHGFSKLTINLTQSVSGAVGLCISLVVGWLSDRVGRRSVMVGAFLLTGAGLLILRFSQQLWHFYLFSSLTAFISVAMAVGPAYLMDVVPREGTARGVSLFQAVFWAGNIAGMVILGLAFEHGNAAPILASSLLPLAGIVFLLLIKKRRQSP